MSENNPWRGGLSAALAPRRRRLAWLTLVLAACTGCSGSASHDWHGYYYSNVLTSGPAQVHGPYDSSSSCIAAMRPLLRHAPGTANFTCARACHADSDGSLETCEEVAHL
ncbi:MAG: hypothetical protein KGJ57_06980 [Sphingomonadales bacterium]|nr:hypothetical protein [Sphingomonadales bacterium]MDE2169155.1 hypothetical protein [Sphingomonadales bacterium]